MIMRRIIEGRQPLPPELRAGIRQARLQIGDPAQLARIYSGVQREAGGTGGGGLLPLAGGRSALTRGHWLMLVGASLGVLLAAGWVAVRAAPVPAPAMAALGTAREAPEPSDLHYLVLGRATVPDEVALSGEPAALPEDAGPPRRVARAPEPQRPAAARGLDPQGELEILRVAQAELRRRPSASLQQVQLHQARYPEGVFSQEREVIRIDALFALRRDGEAREHAQQFLARYGGSTHAPRMRSLLGAP